MGDVNTPEEEVCDGYWSERRLPVDLPGLHVFQCSDCHEWFVTKNSRFIFGCPEEDAPTIEAVVRLALMPEHFRTDPDIIQPTP